MPNDVRIKRRAKACFDVAATKSLCHTDVKVWYTHYWHSWHKIRVFQRIFLCGKEYKTSSISNRFLMRCVLTQQSHQQSRKHIRICRSNNWDFSTQVWIETLCKIKKKQYQSKTIFIQGNAFDNIASKLISPVFWSHCNIKLVTWYYSNNRRDIFIPASTYSDCRLFDKNIPTKHIFRTSALVDCHRQYAPWSITRQGNVQSIIR